MSAAPPGLWRRVQGAWQWLHGLPDRLLFGPASRQAGPTAGLLRAARYPYALLRDLAGGRLNLHAMGLVYASLVSVIPLLALSFGILTAFDAQNELRPLVREFLSPMGGAANALTDRVMQFARNVHGGLVGSLGFGLLVWTLFGTMRKVEDGFNFVWHVDVARGFARRSADYLILLLAGPLLLAVVTVFSRVAGDSNPLRALADVPWLDRALASTVRAAPYLLVSGLLTTLYLVVPNTRVRFRPALIGGITAGILWAAVGHLFTAFVLYSARLTLVYAGFAIIIAALVWTYFGWIILLFGAQVSFYAQNPGYLRGGFQQPRLSNAEIERLALGIMYFVAERERDGGAPHSVSSLALRSDYPGIAVARACDGLVGAGLLVRTAKLELRLAGEAGQLRVLAILLAARHQRSGPPHNRAAIPAAVEDCCREFERALEERLASLSLSDLLRR